MKTTLTGIPKEIVEVLGNLIRKVAYTQLNAIRVVGIGISGTDGKMILPTNTIEGTTTLLDIISKLVDCDLHGGVPTLEEQLKNTSKDYILIETSFTNLKEKLSEYMDVSNLPDDLLITSVPHLLKLQVMRIEHDMCQNSLQAHMSDGVVPIPRSVTTDFQLDYSRKDEGILMYTIQDELAGQLQETLEKLKNSITPIN